MFPFFNCWDNTVRGLQQLTSITVCVCIVLLKSLSQWQRHRGFWHRLSCWRSLLPLLLSLLISTHFLSSCLQIFKNHITIPTAARGAEMKGGNNLSLSLSASYPSAKYSELGNFQQAYMSEKDINVLIVIFFFFFFSRKSPFCFFLWKHSKVIFFFLF